MAIAQKIYHHFTWRGVVMLTQLVIHVLLARYLGPEGSGGFFLGLNNLALVILIVGFSLEGAAIYFRLAQKMEPSELAGALLVWALFATTIVALVVLLTGIPLIEELHPAWSIGYVLSFLLINSFSSLFQSEGDFKQYNQVIAGFNILYLIFLGMLLWNRNESGATASGKLDTQWVAIIYAAYFFTVLAQAAVITLRYWMHMAPPRWNRPRMEVFKKLLGYGGMALVSNLVFFLIMRIDYWLVNYYCSQKDLGIYIQVTKATQMLVLPGQLLSTILFPHTAGNQQFVQQPLLMKLLKPFLAGNLIVILLIAFFGEFLIALVWGNAYYSIFTPLLWALPGVLSLTLSYFFSPILAGLGKVSLNIFTGMMTLGVLVITDLLLIPRWGIQGAAIGSSTAFMVMLIIYIIIANKLGFRFQPGAPRSVQ